MSEFSQQIDIFLIGDTGNISRNGNDLVLECLAREASASPQATIIFLGDNVYPKGLPAEGHLLRKDAEDALLAHHRALAEFKGRMIFISGNHDWNKGRKDGYEYVLRQETFLKALFGEQLSFLPPMGCPGPSVVDLHDKFKVVLINTQWWLQSGFRPIGKQFGCDVETEEEFYERLEEVLKREKDSRVLVCGHAPVYSYAIHGGRYKLKHHLFPFTIYHQDAYIPLPFIGSLLPLYRKYLGAKEDIAHPRYRRLRNHLKKLFAKYPGTLYAAGHEHNLQHIVKDHVHYLVSGAGSKLKYVLSEGRHLRFGIKEKGFMKIRVSDSGHCFLMAYVVNKRHPEGKLVYENQLI